MLNNPMAVDADKNLLDVLSQIKSSRFLEECTRMIDVAQLDEGHNISTPELPKAYVEYVQLRNKLDRWQGIIIKMKLQSRYGETIYK
jgi:hypothetical protein